jgi:hypothetical protein
MQLEVLISMYLATCGIWAHAARKGKIKENGRKEDETRIKPKL